MATQTPYTNLSDLKAYLSIADTDTSQDSVLTILISTVQNFVDNYTHRTFGWGDAGDSSNIDYSNTDNIGVLTATIDETNTFLTLTTMGPIPWTVGQNVSLFMMPENDWNGVWAVTSVPNAQTIVVNVTESMGTLSLSDNKDYIVLSAANYAGYIGNYVSNYKYISQQQFDGLVGHTIYLRHSDIRSIDTLYIGLRNIAQPVLLDHTQYVWRNDGRVILGGAYFNTYNSALYVDSNDNSFYGSIAAGYQTITISYWQGHIGVPEEISLATLDLCAAMNVMRKQIGLQQERIGDYEVRYDILLRKALASQPDTLNVLNRWRKIHI